MKLAVPDMISNSYFPAIAGACGGFRSLRITSASSPGLSRRPRMLWHGAIIIGVAGTSPATTLSRC